MEFIPLAAFSDFAPGISALLGVLLGGLITLRVEENRRANEAARDKQQREREATRELDAEAKRVKAVARVWQDEFARALTALAMAEKAGNTWVPPPGGVYFEQMDRQERLLLAANLDDDDWLSVVLGHANLALVVGGLTSHAGKPIDPTLFDFRAGARYLTEAHEALSHITGSESHTRLGYPHTPTPKVPAPRR